MFELRERETHIVQDSCVVYTHTPGEIDVHHPGPCVLSAALPPSAQVDAVGRPLETARVQARRCRTHRSRYNRPAGRTNERMLCLVAFRCLTACPAVLGVKLATSFRVESLGSPGGIPTTCSQREIVEKGNRR